MAFRKTAEGVSEMGEVNLPKVKHVVAYLAKQGGNMAGALPVAEMDVFISSWVDKGYQLKTTHYLGENPDGIGVLYIFVLA